MTAAFEADQVKQEPLLSVSVYEGKYTVIQAYNGGLSALRYGEPWRDCCGDGLILSLAGDLDETRAKLAAQKQRIAELESTLHECEGHFSYGASNSEAENTMLTLVRNTLSPQVIA